MEQAWANLEAEATGKTFDQARADARKVWNTELSKIEVQGGTEENKVKFYTALYQVLLGRGKSSDANGKYISNLNEVKQIPLATESRSTTTTITTRFGAASAISFSCGPSPIPSRPTRMSNAC